MITAAILNVVYRIIVAVLALTVIWDIVKEKSFAQAVNLGIVSIPLILRALMIK